MLMDTRTPVRCRADSDQVVEALVSAVLLSCSLRDEERYNPKEMPGCYARLTRTTMPPSDQRRRPDRRPLHGRPCTRYTGCKNVEATGRLSSICHRSTASVPVQSYTRQTPLAQVPAALCAACVMGPASGNVQPMRCSRPEPKKARDSCDARPTERPLGESRDWKGIAQSRRCVGEAVLRLSDRANSWENL